MMNLNNIHSIIEVFENFLDSRHITIPNEDKAQSDHPANIYGMDYAELQSELSKTLATMGIPVKDTWDEPERMQIVPVNFALRRFYRTYLRVPESAGREEIENELRARVREADFEHFHVMEDPELEVEDSDILMVEPDFEAAYFD